MPLEETCYAKQSSIIRKNLAMVRENLKERERVIDQIIGIHLCLLVPMAEHLTVSVSQPLILILIRLAVRTCILSCMASYIKQRINSEKLLVLRINYAHPPQPQTGQVNLLSQDHRTNGECSRLFSC